MTKDNVAQLRTNGNKDGGLSAFLQLIKRGENEVFSEAVTFTKPIIEWLIERNPQNRRMNKVSVEIIASDIRNGLWQFNGETIVIAKTGELNDGQHRLYAFHEAGVPVKSNVAFGLTRDSRYSVDIGRARNPSDFLSMHGVTNTALTAATVNLYLLYKKGVYGRAAFVGKIVYNTKQDILEEYENNRDMYDEAVAVSQSSKFVRVIGASAFATAYIIISSIAPSKAEVFFERLIEGDKMDKGDPILVLRNKLSQKNERLFSNERLELILRHWNAWRSGKQLVRASRIEREYPKVVR